MNSLKNYTFRIAAYIFSFAGRLKGKGLEPPQYPKRILLVKTHAIGDTIMITPAINALRNRFTQARIVLLTGKLSKEIMAGNSDLDEILSFDESALFAPDLLKIIGLAKQIRKERFDIAFIFHYSTFMHLLAMSFGIPFRVGYDKSGSGFLLTHKVSWDDKGERWTADVHLDLTRMVKAENADKRLKIIISDDDAKFADNFLRSNNIGRDDILIGIFPGGGKNSRDTVYQKRWGIENYAVIIDMLFAKYNAKIIVFGSQNDEAIVEKLMLLSKTKIINACGKNLKQVSSLIKKCSLFITNDSAPLHIAIAMDTPTVSIFGPSRATAIMKQSDRHIAIQSKYPCSPCYCNSVFSGCDNPQCMEAIGCDEVLTMAERQLNKFCLKNKEQQEEKAIVA